jgi:hypothetical protein
MSCKISLVPAVKNEVFGSVGIKLLWAWNEWFVHDAMVDWHLEALEPLLLAITYGDRYQRCKTSDVEAHGRLEEVCVGDPDRASLPSSSVCLGINHPPPGENSGVQARTVHFADGGVQGGSEVIA